MIKRGLGIVVILAYAWNAFAQDPQFTQFYANQLYLNPAFTGETDQVRAAINYRNQWPSIPGAFVTKNLALDYNLAELNSGFGLLIMRDKTGSGGLRFTNVAFSYSYRFDITRKLHMKSAVQVANTTRDLDFNRLVFGDQLLIGNGGATTDNIEFQKVNYLDANTGFLLYSSAFWLGGSMHHLNRPNQSLLSRQSILPTKYSVHGGYRLPITDLLHKYEKRNVVMAFNYRLQEEYDQLDIGFYYEREPLTVGVWYRGLPGVKYYVPEYINHDAIAVLFGVELHNVNIGYSYDITISRLVSHSGGAHEISLIYEYSNGKSSRRRKIVPCAKF